LPFISKPAGSIIDNPACPRNLKVYGTFGTHLLVEDDANLLLTAQVLIHGRLAIIKRRFFRAFADRIIK
jgi:hypothetical protein